jgi:hypothetical protein
MRHPFATLALACSIAAMPLALACRPGAGGGGPSGDSLGTFLVHGALQESGCAPGLEPIDPIEFRVELSRTGGSLLWRMPGGQPVSGTIATDGDFHLRTMTQVEAWPADPDTGIPGCTIAQVETVDGTLTMAPSIADGGDAAQDELDAGASDGGATMTASLEATNRIEIVPVAGSDCSALLLVNGGSFPSLPCAARYELAGAVE